MSYNDASSSVSKNPDGSMYSYTSNEDSHLSRSESRSSSSAPRFSIASIVLEWPSSDDDGASHFSFSDLTDAQFLEQMAEKEAEARHLAIENEVFFRYLEENDPILFQEAILIIEQAMLLKFGSTDEGRDKPRARTSRSSKISLLSIFSLMDGKGPRVNLVQKSDMVLKAIEEKQAALDGFLKKSHRTKRKLLSEMEEFQIREGDITAARNIFEYHVVIEGVDSLTQRIPAEKFLKYMDDWLKSASLDIEKLRLRTAYIKLQYKKVSATLERRKELRENLHAVDFDKLEIENKHFCEQLEVKTVNMIELKRMFADSNRVLNYQKKYVMECQLEAEIYRKKMKQLEKSIKSIGNECEVVETELLHAQKKYEDFIYISNNYRVPDVMEYVNMKKEHAEVVKRIKIWQRKKKVLDISLRAAIREIMNNTGSKIVDPSWFKDVDDQSAADMLSLPSHFPEPVREEVSHLPQTKEVSRMQSSMIKSGKHSLLKHKKLQVSEQDELRSPEPSRISELSSEVSSRISWTTRPLVNR